MTLKSSIYDESVQSQIVFIIVTCLLTIELLPMTFSLGIFRISLVSRLLQLLKNRRIFSNYDEFRRTYANCMAH